MKYTLVIKQGQNGFLIGQLKELPAVFTQGLTISDISPLAMIDRTCQVCHRESEATLRDNVYERQNKANGQNDAKFTKNFKRIKASND